MPINVRYLASLAEQLGRDRDIVEARAAITVTEVWQRALPEQELPARILVAVNHVHAGADSLVHDGDEVAFFPPVTGG